MVNINIQHFNVRNVYMCSWTKIIYVNIYENGHSEWYDTEPEAVLMKKDSINGDKLIAVAMKITMVIQ
jgi:hypothetical protein